MSGYHVGEFIENVGEVESINGEFVTITSYTEFRSAKHALMHQLGFDHVGPWSFGYGMYTTTYRMKPNDPPIPWSPPIPPEPYRWSERENIPNGGHVMSMSKDFVTIRYNLQPGVAIHQFMLDHGWQYCGPTLEQSNGSWNVTYQKCGAARA